MRTAVHRCAFASILALVFAAVMPSTAVAQDAQMADWKFRAIIYGWFPTVSGQSSHPSDGGATLDLQAEDYLKNLRFVFMGALEAQRGRWGLLTDYIYLDFDAEQGATRNFALRGPGGGISIPADAYAGVNLRLRGWAWSLLGTYALSQRPDYEVQLLGGTRFLKMNTTVDWQFSGNVGALPPFARSGASTTKSENWDAVVGAKGRYRFGDGRRWFVPYYLDVGTGESDLTWQAMSGVGYAFSWGELLATYRHLDYKFKSGSGMQDLTFSGPAIGLGIRW